MGRILMPEISSIERSFKQKVCDEISLSQEGIDRYLVFTPFEFQDGDEFVIILKKKEAHWVLTDENHTLMHISLWIDEDDLAKESRWSIVSDTIRAFSLKEINGELLLEVEGDHFGDALFSYIQALMKIADITYLIKERVQSAFLDDLNSYLNKIVSPDHIQGQWYEPRDKKQNYVVDYMINRLEKPVFIFALNNEMKILKSALTLYHFEKIGVKNHSIGIFEEQENINRKSVSKLMDICDKTFSNLYSNKERIHSYLKSNLPEEYILAQ
jgi:hypothetical protein